MGLADALAAFASSGYGAGLGQGLAAGAQNYTHGLAQQAEEEARRKQLLMQQQQHDFDQNTKLYALQQHEAQGAAGRQDWGSLAGMQGGLNSTRQHLGLAAQPLVTGTHVAAQPARNLPQYGPMWSGEALPNKGLAATPERTDYSPQDQQGLMAAAGYTPPKWEHANGSLFRPNADGTVDIKELPNPYRLTADQQFTMQDKKGQQRLDAGKQRDAARMAVAQFTQSQIGQRFAASLKSKEYLTATRQDPAKHYATLVAMAKTLAGPRDMTDIDGAAQQAKIQEIMGQLVQQFPGGGAAGPAGAPAQGGSSTGRTPFPPR